MPEGPEVAIIAQVLNDNVIGKIVKNIIIFEDSRYPPDGRFYYIIGMKITMVSFKGKKIIFVFNSNGTVSYLVSSLGMEGRWLYNKDSESSKIESKRHLSVGIDLEPTGNITFWDQRHFGELVLCPTPLTLETKLLSVGPPWIPSILFSQIITKDEFTDSLYNIRLKRKTIMMFLMDQQYSSGIGNYIRSEALYIAKINPHRLINYLTLQEASTLYRAITEVMNKSYRAGGYTLKSYYTPVGKTGGYIPLVYSRNKSLDMNIDVIREMDSKKRSIHWAPAVQV